MKRMLLTVIVGVGLLLPQTTVYADSIEGMIKNVDSTSRTLTIERSNAKAGEAREIQVKIPEDAKFKNFNTFGELQNGQEVKLDARENKDLGSWDAKSVELKEAEAGKTMEQPSGIY